MIYRALMVCCDDGCDATYEVFGPLEELESLACDCECALQLIGWPEPVEGSGDDDLELIAA